MSESTTVAELLERSAIRVEASPGLNVLDALREETRDLPNAARDALLGDVFYRLLDYLPAHVDSLARWSDSETSDRVAGKLRQLAATMRKGGPALVEAIVPPAAPAEVELLDTAGSRNHRGASRSTAQRSREADWPRDAQLRAEIGRLQSVLTRMRRAKHPRSSEIVERELQLVDLERELASIGEGAAGTDADSTDAGAPVRRAGVEHAEHAQVAS